MLSSAVALFAAPAFGQEEYDTDKNAVDGAYTESEAVLDADETQMDTDGDGDLETLKNGYTDEHAWIDAEVTANGERVGDIERVHYEGEEIDRIVIETPGVAEIGGREVEISLEEAELVTAEDGTPSFMLAMSVADFDALPAFDESLASDYPLSDNPAEDEDSLGETDESYDDVLEEGTN
jgi:hypothetical protein